MCKCCQVRPCNIAVVTSAEKSLVVFIQTWGQHVLTVKKDLFEKCDLKQCNHINHIKLDATCLLSEKMIWSVFITLSWVFVNHCSLTLSFLSLCIVWSSSVARGGHSGGTTAGMRGVISSVRLCKCPPYIHHQTIKITLQPSIITSLSPPQPLLSGRQLKPPQASC